MQVHTPAGHRWPARLAYAAALIFSLASTGTNLLYGIGKGTDWSSSLVWASVSVAVSVVFALSWPALLLSLQQRQWARAIIVFVALSLSGTYSIIAALGSAGGGRADATAQEQTSSDTRAKLGTSYETAKAELTTLAKTRPAAELRALIDGVKTDPRSGGCAMVRGSTEMRCPRLTSWRAELARAERRQELSAIMTKAQSELARAPAQANSDVVALTTYLAVLGVGVPAETVNGWLVLLAVLIVECGSGLSMAIGMSFAGGGQLPDGRSVARTQEQPNARTSGPDTSPNACISGSCARPPTPDTLKQRTMDATDKNDAAVRFLEFLKLQGGVLVSGQRQIGRALGWSKSWTHEVLHALAKARRVELTTTRAGTVVQLTNAAA